MGQTLEIKTTNGKLFWENEKPKLNLIPLEKTRVGISTQKDYDELMQVYEVGGWRWITSGLPTSYNHLAEDKEKIYLDAGSSHFWNFKEFFEYSYEEDNDHHAISVKNFYEIQKITQGDLIELNKYFEKNFPNRVSKVKNKFNGKLE